MQNKSDLYYVQAELSQRVHVKKVVRHAVFVNKPSTNQLALVQRHTLSKNTNNNTNNTLGVCVHGRVCVRVWVCYLYTAVTIESGTVSVNCEQTLL